MSGSILIEKGVSMNKKIRDYIKLERSKGISFDDIKKGLQKVGWPEKEITTEIEEAKKSDNQGSDNKSFHVDKNWLWIILPIVIIGLLFYFTSSPANNNAITKFDWLSLGDNIFNLKPGQDMIICYLPQFAVAIQNPDAYPDGITLDQGVDVPVQLFESSEIYNANALRIKNINQCDHVEDPVLRQFCRATIGKDENTCTNNPVLADYCTSSPDDDVCRDDNMKNMCLGYLHEDASYCNRTDFEDYCYDLVTLNSAVYEGDASKCPTDDIVLNLECRTEIDGKSPLPFEDPGICSDSYYSQKSYY